MMLAVVVVVVVIVWCGSSSSSTSLSFPYEEQLQIALDRRGIDAKYLKLTQSLPSAFLAQQRQCQPDYLAETFDFLPEDYGLKKCLGPQFVDLVNHFSDGFLFLGGSDRVNALPSQCSFAKVVKLFKSTKLQKLWRLLMRELNGENGLLRRLFDSISSDDEFGEMCNDPISHIPRCVKEFVNGTMYMIEQDRSGCCFDVQQRLEAFKLIVPYGVDPATHLVNSIAMPMEMLCTRITPKEYYPYFYTANDEGFVGRRGGTCGYTLTREYVAPQAEVASSFLFEFLIPAYTLPPPAKYFRKKYVEFIYNKDNCEVIYGAPFKSRITGKTMNVVADPNCWRVFFKYSRRIFGGAVQNVLGDKLENIMRLITKDDYKTPFFHYYSTCFNTIMSNNYFDRFNGSVLFERVEPIDPAVDHSPLELSPSKLVPNIPKETKCEVERLCDDESLCYYICKPGSVSIPTWVSHAISYQNQLNYAKPLCYSQFAASTQSATNFANGYGYRDQLINYNLNPKNEHSYFKSNHQILSVTDQLRLGVRYLEIEVHYFIGDLRIGHCGTGLFNSEFVKANANAFHALLMKYSEKNVEWDSSLIGCLPSMSGNKAANQVRLRETLKEIHSWLLMKENVNETLLVNFKLGQDIYKFDKLQLTMNQIRKEFQNLIFKPSDLEKHFNKKNWSGVKLRDISELGGKRLVLISEIPNELMFGEEKMCANGWSSGPPDPSLSVRKQKDVLNTNQDGSISLWHNNKPNDGKLLLVSTNSIHYGTLTPYGRLINSTQPNDYMVTPENVGVFVRSNVNFLEAGPIDVKSIKSLIWSWAPNEPSIVEGRETFVVVRSSSGRWHTTSKPPKQFACILRSRQANEKHPLWRIASESKTNCENSAYVFGQPTDVIEHELLLKAIKVNNDGYDGNKTSNPEVEVAIAVDIVAEEKNSKTSQNNKTGDTNPKTSSAIKSLYQQLAFYFIWIVLVMKVY